VGERQEALEVEHRDVETAVEGVERRAPPSDQHGDERGRDERARDRYHELRREPAATRHALRPTETMGAMLEVEHERRREQYADQAGHEVQPYEDAVQAVEACVEQPDR